MKNNRRHIITVTLLSVTIAVLVLGLLVLGYWIMKSSKTTSDTFDITQTTVGCSDASTDVRCLCKKGNESQKICFQSFPDTHQVQVTVPLLRFSQSFSLDTLSTDEDQGQPFRLLNIEYTAFKNPWVPDALCFRSMSDPNKPQRLCYQPKDHTVFLSGPTKVVPETI